MGAVCFFPRSVGKLLPDRRVSHPRRPQSLFVYYSDTKIKPRMDYSCSYFSSVVRRVPLLKGLDGFRRNLGLKDNFKLQDSIADLNVYLAVG
jgi:hypothetical protein